MRSILVFMVALSLGAFAGYRLADSEISSVGARYFAPPDEVFSGGGSPIIAKEPPLSRTEGPRVELPGGTEHDFGSMERFSTKRHVFEVKNAGTQALALTAASTSCKCTVFEIAKPQVEPGETTTVTLEWQADTKESDLEFRVEASITTNDPDQPLVQLVARGKVTRALRAIPDELTLTGVSVSEGTAADVSILAFRHNDLAILRHELEHKDSADLYEVEVVPLAAEKLQEAKADSGVQVRVRVKPGLPLGKIDQRIILTTSVPEASTFKIHVTGNVVGDIAVLGPRDFDNEAQQLNLGLVPSAEGKSVALRVLVKGLHRDTTQISVGSVEPSNGLQVTVGEPSVVSDGGPLSFPLTIAVPKGAPVMNRLGGFNSPPGQIVLETTHPDAKRILISVLFAVR